MNIDELENGKTFCRWNFLHTLGISVWWKGVHLGLGNDLLFNSMQSEKGHMSF